MRTGLAVALTLTAVSAASAAPFRPFVDEVGVTADGVIITTTKASGQDDPPTASRHQVRVFTPSGTEIAAVHAERALEDGAPISRRHWKAIDGWLSALGARRLAARPLLERPCRTRPEPGDEVCPTDPSVLAALVRMPAGVARWNVDGASPIWAWGEPRVVEVGAVCVLLLPDNRGLLDRIEATAARCP